MEQTAAINFRHDEDVISGDSQEERTKKERFYRYQHLCDEDREVVDLILQGGLELDRIPQPQSKVVKIFISSTFTDMTQERNALTENVYPKLRQYCRNKYGVDFQAVDMRWGVPPEASDDHSGPLLCLTELRHCQDLSIGPNFVALLGQRYGSCPLPAAIVRSEFEAIRDNLESADDIDLLETCFLKDQNTIPAVYRLQPASKINEKTGLVWASLEKDLRAVLYKGAQAAVDKSELSQNSLRLLKASVTELEVYQGLVNVLREKERNANCMLYIRDIDGIDTEIDTELVRRFRDLHPNTHKVNVDSERALGELRDKCASKVVNQNMQKTTVQWDSEKGVHPEKHKNYLDTLCNHFYSTVKLLIDRNTAKRNILRDDKLFTEVSQHWTIARSRCETFVGRENLLKEIRGYLEAQTDQAIVVYGDVGSGKTSLMSKAANLLNDVIVNRENEMRMAVIVRFIGTTPYSCSIHQLLYSICHQLAYIAHQHRSEVPQDYTTLKVYFRHMVQKGNFNGVVTIFLDGLDQLSDANGAHALGWLPARLAPNVKIIVSTLPEKFKICEKLRNKIEIPFLHVTCLPAMDSKQVMRVLLEHADRSITYTQWRLVEKAFSKCTLPLFITLTFQEAIRWNSYDELPDNALEHTIEASINKLFDRLEKQHGKMFVSRALGYATAARNGLSQSELEDILSLDDDVLNSVFNLWEPPIRRIPPNLWSRLYMEISPFLVEREADGIVVLSWYHMQFFTAACERYLKNDNDRITIHTNIADYYMGTWSGRKRKPFTYQARLMKRLNITNPHGRAIRFVPEQPTIFPCNEQSERYNYRKLNQLPYSLIQSGQIETLKKECFCNFGWLYVNLKALPLQQMIGDMMMYVDKDIALVVDALRMSGTALKISPGSLGAEISGRLLPHIHKYPLIRDLVRQCDLRAQQNCPLVPHFQIYSVPGGPLQYEWELDHTIRSPIDVDVFNSPDGILMTAKPYYSKSLKIWELTQGEPRQDLHLPAGEIYPTKDGKYLNIFSRRKFVTVYKSESGEVFKNIDYGYGEVGSVSISNRYIAFTTKCGIGPVIVDLEQGELLHKFTSRTSAVALSKTEEYVVFNSDRSIMLHSLPLLERKCVGKANDEPMQVVFNDSRMTCYVLTKTRLLQAIHFDTVNREATTVDIIEDMESQEFILSHLEHLILLRSTRCLFVVDAIKGKLKHRLQKMPAGVFHKTMTPFSGAGFSPNDDLVVASRDAYIAVWKAATGAPIRLLQASVSPIVKIFTIDSLNKAVTLLKNNTLQVWDLNNLDSDVQHSNEVFDGSVGTLSVSGTTRHILCHGVRFPEAKIVDMDSGKVVGVLQHSKDIDDKIIACELSPLGLFAVTRAYLAERGDYLPGIKTMITDDILWNVNTREQLHHAESNRFVIFNNVNSVIAFVQCVFNSSVDWSLNTYKVTLYKPDKLLEEPYEFQIPTESEFVCKPIIVSARSGRKEVDIFFAVLQFCEKEYHPVTKVEQSRSFNCKLYKHPLLGKVPEGNLLGVKDFLKHADKDDQFVDVRIIDGNNLLMIYAKDNVSANFDKEVGMILTEESHKAAIIYDPLTETVLRHVLHIVKPESILSQTSISRQGSFILDDQLKLFEFNENKLRSTIKPLFASGRYKMAVDGSYIVGISEDQRAVLVVRTMDSELKGRLFIHGKATCLEVADDDRTVIVGCNDGRVMILSLVLEMPDPVTQLVDKLPSRVPPKSAHTPLEADIEHMQQATPELTRLAMGVKEDIALNNKRQKSFRVLATSVTAMTRMKTRSKACSIQ